MARVHIPEKPREHEIHESFNDFILAVHKESAEAARWLGREALNETMNIKPHNSFRCQWIINHWSREYDLNELLVWSNTPQGYNFWEQTFTGMGGEFP